MRSVLDAFVLVALALDEPAAAEVEAVIRRGDCVVAAVNLSEAVDQLARVHRREVDEVRAAFAAVLDDATGVVATDESAAWRATELRSRHYRRRRSELSLADCVALATLRPGDRFVTADPALARAARGEEIEVLALPDTSGRRP